ncbi:MAG: hypothetical protein AAF441_08610 [Pseudomonadota bacterium]
MSTNRKFGIRSALKLAMAAGAFIAGTLLHSGAQADSHAKGPVCNSWVYADVVALDQAFYINRLGALQAGGMIYALRSDVRSTDPNTKDLKPGQVMLRPDKRARPIVLRVNQYECLRIKFTNLLSGLPMQRGLDKTFPVKEGSPYTANQNDLVEPAASRNAPAPPSNPTTTWVQNPTRYAGIHVAGLEPVNDISSDGAFGGANGQFFTPENPSDPASYPINSGLVPPGKSIVYNLYAPALGSYLLTNQASMVGTNLGFGGQVFQGMFGAVTVQPPTAEYYRSQVTNADLKAATTKQDPGLPPQIDYQAVYKPGTRYPSEPDGPEIGGKPVLSMTQEMAPIAGKPARELVYTDLTAIITGEGASNFSKDLKGKDFPEFAPIKVTYPKRRQSWREIVTIYHDNFVAKQSFGAFENSPSSDLFQALKGGRDFFAINYGMAAIGPPIWANRLGVGPMAECATCKYEEFFLSSWPNGDPAMVVDFPANTTDVNGKLILGKKATKAYYPDDPSNVFHSYVGDHTVYQVLHASADITHVHHQHAHQWLHSPNDDNSHYRDSQMISPGAAYTLEYVFRGSGNKNQTPGDSIFHCHFYPHFAQGMWGLWRVHDTFEIGTEMDVNGRPTSGPEVWNRALPDGELPTGSPTPAVVPIPEIAMAPMPARVRVVEARSPAAGNPVVGNTVEVHPDDLKNNMNPGFPFYIPGVAGQRATHPPMDFAPEEDASGEQKTAADGKPLYLDGGLPRHIVVSDKILYEKHNRWDFTKENNKPVAMQLPEMGTPAEKAGMAANAKRLHDSITPGGQPAKFRLNGQPPARGAPFAEPGITLDGDPVFKTPVDYNSVTNDPAKTNVRIYKGADIELDVVFNKKGWHYPQQRIISLWGDVADTLTGKKPAEPLFFRANSGEVVEYWMTNLVPNYYELDDFQVRTPTDVLGQHIHLVKFDVLASDGAANGFNYEDGTYAAQEVRELIGHINKAGGIYPFQSLSAPDSGSKQTELKAKTIPYFGDGKAYGQNWVGAQATVQRWYADPLTNNLGKDRTIRTVFTHDHFSPSTHQQAGLYAALVVEPKDSKWRNPITGAMYGNRNANAPEGGEGKVKDGGPTSWVADILTKDPSQSYREFNLEFADRQLTYNSVSPQKPVPYIGDPDNPNFSKAYADADPATVPAGTKPWGWVSPNNAINAPAGSASAPNPLLVTNSIATGTFSVNYRNEPLALRMFKPQNNPAKLKPQQAAEASDLSFAYASIPRFDPVQNTQPDNTVPINPNAKDGFKFENPFPGAGKTDPYTPLMRAYVGDKVQIRTLVGAHMAPHAFNLHGLRWLFEPAAKNSGFRSTQGMGISEHYEMLFDLPRHTAGKDADYLWITSSSGTDLPYGNWGLLRAYGKEQAKPSPLLPLPNNPLANLGKPAVAVCPANAPVREYHVTATTAIQALGGPVVYNNRGRADTPGKQRIIDPDALLYVHTSDLDQAGRLKSLAGEGEVSPAQAQAAIKPLVLRAAAGDCMKVTLLNRIQPILFGNVVDFQLAPASANAKIPFETSKFAGLHAQLVSEDITQSDGTVIGKNPKDTVVPFGHEVTYTWYAGIIVDDGKGNSVHKPAEFGSASLSPSDPLMQSPYGMIGALVIEPEGSCWKTDPNSRASANVYQGGSYGDCDTSKFLFREHVAVLQDHVIGAGVEAASATLPDVPEQQLVAVDGKWLLNGEPLDKTKPIPMPPGTALIVAVENGKHGFAFYDGPLAESIFQVETGADFQPQPQISPLSFGVAPQGPGHIATLIVKEGVDLAQIAFADTVPGSPVAGYIQTAAMPTAVAPNFTNAVSYGTEPLSYRFLSPDWESNKPSKSPRGIMRYASNTLVNGDPQTPVFTSSQEMPVRMRMLHPAGIAEQTWVLHGQSWQEEPYTDGSTKIGFNRKSQWMGARDDFGPNNQFDIVLRKAGGTGEVTGDYLYRSFIGTSASEGIWGLFRVGETGKDVVTITALQLKNQNKGYVITGVVSVNPSNQQMTQTVTITDAANGSATAIVDPVTGAWSHTASTGASKNPFPLKVVSMEGGEAVANQPISSAVPLPTPPSLVGPSVAAAEAAQKPAPAKMRTAPVSIGSDGRQFRPRGFGKRR